MRRAVLGTVVALVAALLATTGAAAAPPPDAWRRVVPPGDLTFHPATAGAATDLAVLWANGSATATVDLPAAATHLLIDARADRCEGVGPEMEVRVDGELVLAHQVVGNNFLAQYGGAWSAQGFFGDWAVATYAARGEWGPGRHHLSIRFTNDRLTATCDRNLKFSTVAFAGPGPSGEPVRATVRQMLDDDAVTVTPSTAGPHDDPALWSAGTLRFPLDALAAETLGLYLWRTCDAEVEIRVDGEPIIDPDQVFTWPGWWPVDPTWPAAELTYAEAFGRPGSWSDGTHLVEVELLEDRGGEGDGPCDANVSVDQARFTGTV